VAVVVRKCYVALLYVVHATPALLSLRFSSAIVVPLAASQIQLCSRTLRFSSVFKVTTSTVVLGALPPAFSINFFNPHVLRRFYGAIRDRHFGMQSYSLRKIFSESGLLIVACD
jgi:hypothetical protein